MLRTKRQQVSRVAAALFTHAACALRTSTSDHDARPRVAAPAGTRFRERQLSPSPTGFERKSRDRFRSKEEADKYMTDMAILKKTAGAVRKRMKRRQVRGAHTPCT